jgi:hypothetical protein
VKSLTTCSGDTLRTRSVTGLTQTKVRGRSDSFLRGEIRPTPARSNFASGVVAETAQNVRANNHPGYEVGQI